jgi:hypothetical protein
LPLLVAASRSTLSTPIPALPMTLSFLHDSITSLVAFVADLTTKASQSCNSFINDFASRFVLVIASIPFSLKMANASLLSLSAIKTLYHKQYFLSLIFD